MLARLLNTTTTTTTRTTLRRATFNGGSVAVFFILPSEKSTIIYFLPPPLLSNRYFIGILAKYVATEWENILLISLFFPSQLVDVVIVSVLFREEAERGDCLVVAHVARSMVVLTKPYAQVMIMFCSVTVLQ